MSDMQTMTLYANNMTQYRQSFIAIFLRWSFVIVAFCTIIFLGVFIQDPSWAAGMLSVTFVQFLPCCLLCFWLVRHERTRLATWIYLVSGIVAATTFTLFMPTTYLIVGMVGYILFIRITLYLETRKVAYVLAGVCVLLYVVVVFIRTFSSLTPLYLGFFSLILVNVLPILILVLFVLLDQLGTDYLQTALRMSKTALVDLSRSYAALTNSEKQLAKLATQLEGRNGELQVLNEELKSFAYIISHDLRAPLVNLKGFSSELREAVAQIEPVVWRWLPQLSEQEQAQVRLALEKDVPEALSFIESAVTRMDSFINALLRLSRYGRREMSFVPIDMTAIVQTTLRSLAHQLAEKEVAIRVEPLPTITADFVSMEQIMGNLLSNAINYLQPGRPGQVAIWAEETEWETRFFVQDNGRGIAQRDMSKLFEPFRRIGKNDTPGEGMGLAYVQALIRRHNGRIWCDSEPDVGSTFTFTIAKSLAAGERNGEFK